MKVTDLQIVTANFEQIKDLKEEGFILVSVVGLATVPKQEGLEMLRGFSTYQMRYHLKAKDYISCYLLYTQKLEKKGFEKILQQLQELSQKYNSSKIALLGSGKSGEFCFRYIVSDFFQNNEIPVSEYKDEVNMEVQRSFWQHDPYKEAGHHNLSDDFVGKVLEDCKWIFASTMADNPHHYTLRKDFGNEALFLSIVKHIRYFGIFEEFGGMMFRCFFWRNFKYFTHPTDLLDINTDLINKVAISV